MNSNLRSNHGIQINPVVTIIFHMYLCSLYLCLIIYLCFNFSSDHYYYYYYYYHYYYYFFTLGVMLFSDKKCHNSRGQPVVSGIVAIFSFFSFHFELFRIFFITCYSRRSKSNFSIHFSKCFVTVSNAPITTELTSVFFIFHIFAISYFTSL